MVGLVLGFTCSVDNQQQQTEPWALAHKYTSLVAHSCWFPSLGEPWPASSSRRKERHIYIIIGEVSGNGWMGAFLMSTGCDRTSGGGSVWTDMVWQGVLKGLTSNLTM